MTTELTYLALTLILALVHILAPALGRTAQFGLAWNAGARDTPVGPSRPVVGRLERAQSNLFETLPLFIGAVLIAHGVEAFGPLTLWGTTLYFWGRVVYLPLYALGVPYIRSLVWLVSIVGLVMVLASLFLLKA